MSGTLKVWGLGDPLAAADLSLNFTYLNLRQMALGGANMAGQMKFWSAGDEVLSSDLDMNFALLASRLSSLEAGAGTITPPTTTSPRLVDDLGVFIADDNGNHLIAA